MECHISDPDDGITATGTPNSSLGVDFTIVDRYGNKGEASLDSDGTTYTAAGLGPCPV